MKNIIIYFFLFSSGILQAQDEINWDGKYKLQISDFKSASTQIGNVKVYSLFS